MADVFAFYEGDQITAIYLLGHAYDASGESLTVVRSEDHADVIAFQTRLFAPAGVNRISDRQFFQQLAVLEIVTEQEALDAVSFGAIPAALQAIIDPLPAPDKFAAEMLLRGATIFRRDHPLSAAIGAAQGMTSEQIDQFFAAAAAL